MFACFKFPLMAFVDNSTLLTGTANNWQVPGTLTTTRIALPLASNFQGQLSVLQNDVGYLVSNAGAIGNVFSGNGQTVALGNTTLARLNLPLANNFTGAVSNLLNDAQYTSTNTAVVFSNVSATKLVLPYAALFTGLTSQLNNDVPFQTVAGSGNCFTSNGQNVSFGNISAANVSAGAFVAGSVTASNISTSNLTTSNLTSQFVTTGTLTSSKQVLPNANNFTGATSNLLNDVGFLANGASVSFAQIVDTGSISVTGNLTANAMVAQTLSVANVFNTNLTSNQSLTANMLTVQGNLVVQGGARFGGNVGISGNTGIALISGSATAPLEVGGSAKVSALGFQDSSQYNNPTPVQNQIYVSNVSPYTGQTNYGSLYFPGGAQNYVAYPAGSSAIFDWTQQDTCFEMFIYPVSLPPTTSAGWALIGAGAAATSTNFFSLNLLPSGFLQIYYYNMGTTSTTLSTTAVTASQWSHISFTYTKASTTLRLYVNGSGAVTGNTSTLGAYTYNASQPFVVGSLYPYTNTSSTFTTVVGTGPAYITDLRITRGNSLKLTYVKCDILAEQIAEGQVSHLSQLDI